MDEFAQSRADDDLFDDDFVPVTPAEEHGEVDCIIKEVQDISLNTTPGGPSTHEPYTRAYSGRGRRGRGSGADRTHLRREDSSLHKPRHPPAPKSFGDPSVTCVAASINNDTSQSDTEVAQESPIPEVTVHSSPTAVLAEDQAATRPLAVRGDRTATGGIKKPKLTEGELTAKLAAAKARSENLSAAHARAEADAASFEERELAEVEKRTKDTANRKAMEGEREKNRTRKMAVMSGREWDSQKNEDDYFVRSTARGRGRSNHTWGSDGGYRTNYDESFDDDLSQYQWKDDSERSRGRRGRRGRGVERGGPGRGDIRRTNMLGQLNVTAEADFPSLPAMTKAKDQLPGSTGPSQGGNAERVISPIVESTSWADEVEMNEAENRHRKW